MGRVGIVTFTVESRTYKFKNPLMLKIKLADDGVCLSHIKEPYLFAGDKTFRECIKRIKEQLALIWDDYVLAPDNELSADGIALKNKLSAMAEEVSNER